MMVCSDRNFGCRYLEAVMNGNRIVFLENDLLRIAILPDNGCNVADINYKSRDISILLCTRQGLQSLRKPHGQYTDRFNETYHGGWFEAFPNVGLSCIYNDTFFECENARVQQGTTGNWTEIDGKEGILDIRKMHPPLSDINDLYWLSNLKNKWIAVRNNATGIGFGLVWDSQIFDHCLLWMNANGDKGYPHNGDLYTLCVMPSNTGIHNLEAEINRDNATVLNPGESASAWITACAFKHGGSAVQALSRYGKVIYKTNS